MKWNNNALTLIEVMVVMTILSILIFSLYTVFKSGADAWSKSDARLEIFQNARVVLDQISRELPGAFVGSGAEFTGNDGEGTDGSDTLEFVTNFGDSIYKLKYELDLNNVLERKYIKDPPDYANTDYRNVINEDDGIEEAIIDFGFKISNINFRYWNEAIPGWTTNGTWSATSELPKAVEIKIECKDSDGNIYPFETMVYLPNSE